VLVAFCSRESIILVWAGRPTVVKIFIVNLLRTYLMQTPKENV